MYPWMSLPKAESGESYRAEARQAVPIHPLALAVAFQAHGSIGELPHLPNGDMNIKI